MDIRNLVNWISPFPLQGLLGSLDATFPGLGLHCLSVSLKRTLDLNVYWLRHTYNCDTIVLMSRIVSEYDQEITQSQTADRPVAPRGRHQED